MSLDSFGSMSVLEKSDKVKTDYFAFIMSSILIHASLSSMFDRLDVMMPPNHNVILWGSKLFFGDLPNILDPKS